MRINTEIVYIYLEVGEREREGERLQRLIGSRSSSQISPIWQCKKNTKQNVSVLGSRFNNDFKNKQRLLSL